MTMILLLFLLWLILLPLGCALLDYPKDANTNTTWINNNIFLPPTVFRDDSILRPIFVRTSIPTGDYASYTSQYVFGFYCSSMDGISPCNLNQYLLAVVIVQTISANLFMNVQYKSHIDESSYPRVVWCANTHLPVEENANLTFTSGGDLLLSDAGGFPFWSSNTKAVRHHLSLLSTGNLVLADAMNKDSFLWQSFDHPTDTLILGQTLRFGMNLSSSTYGVYLFMEQTNLTLSVSYRTYSRCILSNPTNKMIDAPFVKYVNGSLDLFVSSSSQPDKSLPVRPTPTNSLSFMKVGSDYDLSLSTWIPDYAHWAEEEVPPWFPSPSSGSGRIKLDVILSAVLSSAAVALLLVFVYRRRWQQKRRTLVGDMFATVPGLMPTPFSLKELTAATNNFSTKLGSGGFGSVFLGVLADESEVAVKRLENAKQGQKEFLNEVCIIGSIRHLNLVQLRGFCAEKDCHRLLVYEYMPKGSLEKWLFHKNNSNQSNDAGNINPALAWETRFNIALGIARGLAYLHEECLECIIHLDIKPHNILLDNNFVPKVSDFGLSKLMNREQSHVVTMMRGTPGYLAPEWLHTTTITEKADVYSFGILLFEIASGRKCTDITAELESEVRHIPAWASRMAEEGRLMDVMDARLLQELDVSEAERMVKVALWCIQESPSKRPSMSTVVQMLEGVVECSHPPLNVSHILRTTDQYTARTSTGNRGYNSDTAMGSSPLAYTLSGPRVGKILYRND